MIQSMTGFGKSVVELPHKKITVEIKSLNSKQLRRLPGDSSGAKSIFWCIARQ